MQHSQIAIVGCGFVADYYLMTLKNYPHLKVVGLYDRQHERALHLGQIYGHPICNSLEEILTSSCTIVLNLTNPDNHYVINKACLLAGKHVYSEKPMAMSYDDAADLVALAEKNSLYIVSAPCSLLGEQAQTLMKAVRDDLIGKVWCVYAEMDDGPIHLMRPDTWRSASGVPWPVRDEFEVGCTLEHAGYIVPWLVALFGFVTQITAYSAVRIQDKHLHTALEPITTPDFSVAVLKFESGVDARLSCSIVAPHDHRIKIHGERGTLFVDECWHNGDPVRLISNSVIGLKAGRYGWVRNNAFFSNLFGLSPKKLCFVKKPPSKFRYKRDYMDFARGIDDLARAVAHRQLPIMHPRFCLHVNEIILAIQDSVGGRTYAVKSRAKPLPDAKSAIMAVGH